MKIPLIVTAGIFTVFAVLGLWKHDAIGHLRDEERALISLAVKSGVSPTSGPRQGLVKKPRVNRQEEAGETAEKLIADLTDADKRRPDETDDQWQERVGKVRNSIYQLNGVQLRVLIAQLREAPDPASYQDAVHIAVMALAETDPALAIGLLTETLGDSERSYVAGEVHSHVIGKWATTDPLAAIEWTRNHAEFRKFAGYQETKELILGVAANDPRLAFRLIGEFKPPDGRGGSDGEIGLDFDQGLALQIARTARSLEERTTMLALVREMAENPALSEHAIQVATTALAEGLATHGHEKATAWLASANLRPQEAEWLRASLSYNPDDTTARLIEWLEPVAGEYREDPYRLEK